MKILVCTFISEFASRMKLYIRDISFIHVVVVYVCVWRVCMCVCVYMVIVALAWCENEPEDCKQVAGADR